MTATTKTFTSPIDLYRQGVAVLTDHLGPVDSVRFLRLLDKGSGDYTATRQNQSDEGTVEALCAEIRAFEATTPKT
jgi:hypothetical protein